MNLPAFRLFSGRGALPPLRCAAALICGLTLVPASARERASFKSAGAPAFEPRALQLLQQMTEAYTHLSSLDQLTEFHSALIPLNRAAGALASSEGASVKATETGASANGKKGVGQEQKPAQHFRLIFAHPNRLMMEWREADDNAEAKSAEATPETMSVTRWVSDGKVFWTYSSTKNWYTREKAPAHLRDFAKLANMSGGSLELLMMMGGRPFASLREQVDGARCDPPVRIGETETEVVVLHTSKPTETMDARFYIGKDDFLLRRVTVETTPITTAATETVPGKVGDALDELVDGAPPSSNPTNPPAGNDAAVPKFKTTYRYDNIIRAPASFDAQTFAFSVPPGTLLRQPIDYSGKRLQTQLDQQIADILKSKGLTRPKKLHVLRY